MSRILLIEDNEMNRDMLSRRLRKKGYEVSLAVDGESGLSQVASDNPDLVLLDISLPDIDGFEVLSRIRSNESLRHLPVIALTAHAMGDDRAQALARGFDEHDTKPVELDRLLEKMAGLLGQARARFATNGADG